MKKLLFLSLLSVSLLSCSGDDIKNSDNQSNQVTSQSITGVWKLNDGTLNGKDLNLTDCEKQNTVTFEESGRTAFTYHYKNGSNCRLEATDKGDWVKDGNIITITWDDSDEGLEVYKLTVTELSGSTIKWSTDLDEEGILKETYVKQ